MNGLLSWAAAGLSHLADLMRPLTDGLCRPLPLPPAALPWPVVGAETMDMARGYRRGDMTEQQWQESSDPLTMLRHLTHAPNAEAWGTPLASGRKLRLFGAQMLRQFEDGAHLADAVDDYADGVIDGEGLRARWVSMAPLLPDGTAAPEQATQWMSDLLESILGRHGQNYRAGGVADLLRDIVGNPFQRYAWSAVHDAAPSGHGLQFLDERWRTTDVWAVARDAYEHRDAAGHLDPVRLAVLSDALEEAGCPAEQSVTAEVHVTIYPEPPRGWTVQVSGDDLMPKSPRIVHRERRREVAIAWAERILDLKLERKGERSIWGSGRMVLSAPHPLLAHLRSPGLHVRGCWALDLILNKE